MLRLLNRFGGRITAGSGDDRDSLLDQRHTTFDNALVLVIGKRWRLSCGATENEPVSSLFDLPFNQIVKSRPVNLAVFKRRN